MDMNLLLFDGFETLDLFGPVEIFGKEPSCTLRYYSLRGGVVRSAQGAEILTRPAGEAPSGAVWVVPGGQGTRKLAADREFLDWLRGAAESSLFCLSICTGSALLGACGALDGRRATSNKKAMDWVASTSSRVAWDRKARWVTDGKFYTSSGVSAGIDMALAFIADRFGEDRAEAIARHIEYHWNSNAGEDVFTAD